jgi:hypothetical protein
MRIYISYNIVKTFGGLPMTYKELLKIAKKYPNCCEGSYSNRKFNSQVYDSVRISVTKDDLKGG